MIKIEATQAGKPEWRCHGGNLIRTGAGPKGSIVGLTYIRRSGRCRPKSSGVRTVMGEVIGTCRARKPLGGLIDVVWGQDGADG